jgi:hypothetical protein
VFCHWGTGRAWRRFLERIARFVSPPRVHRHRYHGVLAPNARLRPAVVAVGSPQPDAPPGIDLPHATWCAKPPASDPHRRPATLARIRWAQLLARIYDMLPLLCPACGGDMRILAFITDARRPTPRA